MSTTTITGTTTLGVSLTSTAVLNETVANYGTINTAPTMEADGVFFSSSGEVINGSASDTAALIESDYFGIQIPGPVGSVDNFGTILAPSGGLAGVNLGDVSAANIVNGTTTDHSALIYGAFGGVVVGTGTVLNYGSILSGALPDVSNYGVAMLGGTVSSLLINDGLIAGATGVMAGDGVTITNAGTIIGTGTDQLAALMETGSTLIVEGGSTLEGLVTAGVGAVLELAPGIGSLSGLGTTVEGFMTIAFDTSTVWTLEGDAAGLAAGQTIEAFNAGDTLILDGFTALSESYVSGVELELSDGTSSLTLDITPAVTGATFTVQDVAGNTEITLCYLAGTRILTARGECLVETLRVGDLVYTRFGGLEPVRWIGRQSYDPRFLAPDRQPVCILPGALGVHSPAQSLFVSPGHSVLIGETLILARDLVNGISITQGDWAGPVEYYAIELVRHDCILANHAWSESYADGPGLRTQFHNAHEFYGMYPGHIEPTKLNLCAPRPESGPAFERALLSVLGPISVTPGPLHGYVDEADASGLVRGWAQDMRHPELPVRLCILANGHIVARTLAHIYRPDLQREGLGSGRHGFEIKLPCSHASAIDVCREVDNALLPLTSLAHSTAA